MRIRQTLAILATAAALSLPGMAIAQGCHSDKQQITAMSCIEGQVWDQTTGSCIAQPSS